MYTKNVNNPRIMRGYVKRFIKVVNSEHLNRLINMANSSKKQLTQISPVEQLRNSNPSSNNGTGTVQQSILFV